jgi:hypothetical protein
LLHQFIALGLKQKVFAYPICTWHFYHKPESAENVRAQVAFNYLQAVKNKMRRGENIIPLNPPKWGLEGEKLDEYAVNDNNSQCDKNNYQYKGKMDKAYISLFKPGLLYFIKKLYRGFLLLRYKLV